MLSVINSTHATWHDLNFAELQKVLEATVVELAANREKGETSRTELVQQTRDFRKGASEEVRKAVLTLLKAFQTEIDASRKRCKFAEDAYISVYQKLMDLPDPTLALAEVQSLQKRVNKSMDLEVELRKFKESNEQLKAEVISLRPLEQENKRLQKSIDEMTSDMGSRVEMETTKMKETTDRLLLEKEHELLIVKAETADKLSVMEEKCTSLTKALELAQSEVFKLKIQLDKSDVGRSSEVELLMDELDKSHAKIKDLEEALSASGSGSAACSVELDERIVQLNSRIEELEADLADKENENNMLTTTVQKLRTDHELLVSSRESTVGELERSLSSVTAQLEEARQQLARQSDYAEIARELRLLRSIEFPEDCDPTESESRNEDTSEAGLSDRASSRKQSLEVLLMNKNRQLQNQLAELNAARDRMTVELDRLHLYETESHQQAQEQSELIQLLESDLYRLQMALNDSGRTQLVSASYAQPQRHASLNVESAPTNQTHSYRREGRMLAEAMGEQQPDEEDTQKTNPGPNTFDASLLQIVQNQRDRFRARAEELEQSETSIRQQLGAVQRELESVRADNVKLYEKIRFLQSYSSPIGETRRTASRTPTAAGGAQHSGNGLVAVQLDPTLAKYSQAYEAHMDPFNQFSRQERQRVYGDLKPYEKIMLRLGRLVLGNRRARFMAFAYALVLHILIFLALYNAAHFQRTADEAEASCLQRYADHMRAAHPEDSNRH